MTNPLSDRERDRLFGRDPLGLDGPIRGYNPLSKTYMNTMHPNGSVSLADPPEQKRPQFTGPERDELAIRMLCAWNGVGREQANANWNRSRQSMDDGSLGTRRQKVDELYETMTRLWSGGGSEYGVYTVAVERDRLKALLEDLLL